MRGGLGVFFDNTSVRVPEQCRRPRGGIRGPAPGAEQPQHEYADAEPGHPSHHTLCSALVNAAPLLAAAGATIAPEIATPRVVPVCRPTEASEAATPAIDVGIPEIAELVIGGLTVPRAMPNSR